MADEPVTQKYRYFMDEGAFFRQVLPNPFVTDIWNKRRRRWEQAHKETCAHAQVFGRPPREVEMERMTSDIVSVTVLP